MSPEWEGKAARAKVAAAKEEVAAARATIGAARAVNAAVEEVVACGRALVGVTRVEKVAEWVQEAAAKEKAEAIQLKQVLQIENERKNK